MSKFKAIIDWLLNRNPLIGFMNGYKMQIGGMLAGLALVIDSVVSFCPPEVAAQLIIISTALKALAGYFGVVGGIGKLAKG